MERSSSTRSPYLITVDPGSDTNCRLPTAQTRPAADRRIRFLSEKVVCRTARTQQYSDGQDDQMNPWHFGESFEMHAHASCADYPEGFCNDPISSIIAYNLQACEE
jgi:hypothetical protein